jgi:hypothetical protein
MAAETGLIGHWRLEGDCKDASGNGNDGRNLGADLSDGQGALFDGRSGVIEVGTGSSPRLGTGDFSVAAWIETERELDDTLGDILSKFDPVTRRGFQLGVQCFAGVTSAQANDRNLQFSLDAGTAPAWTERGRPGNSVYVCALCVHEGALYAGTFEADADEVGHVYRFAGGTEWVDCGSPERCNAVTSLAVCDGRLYAGVSHYRAAGSALPESPNLHPGGRIYRYEGGTQWAACGKLGGPGSTSVTAEYSDYVRRFAGWAQDEVDSVHGLVVYRGKLYAIPIYHQGAYRYDGGTTWTDCGGPGVRMMALTAFNGSLYGAGNEGNGRGGIYRYDGGRTWTRTGDQEGVNQVYSFAIHEGKLYAGTWPEAAVFRYEGGETWTHRGRLGDEKEVMGMAVYNGKLYAGTLPLAEIYRYDGDAAWTKVGRLDLTPEVTYRRAWSMAVFQGQLFCGTLPSGRVHAMAAGQVVTHDHALAPGWRHVAAVREGARLTLSVDGVPVATSSGSHGALDIANDQPLRIGFGAHDHFRGRIRDVRLYDRALGAEEVGVLARR